MSYDVAALRTRFPSLASGIAHFDGPGGTQVPREVADAVAATKVIPWVKAQDQLSWFAGPSGGVADGKIAKAYALTARFLKSQGRVSTTPSAQQIAQHLDASYVKQALKDGCDK